MIHSSDVLSFSYSSTRSQAIGVGVLATLDKTNMRINGIVFWIKLMGWFFILHFMSSIADPDHYVSLYFWL